MRTRSGSRAYRCAFSIFPIMLEFICSLLPSSDAVIWIRRSPEGQAHGVKVAADQKQEQHPGTFARGAVRCSCGMLSPDPWARLQPEWTLGRRHGAAGCRTIIVLRNCYDQS